MRVDAADGGGMGNDLGKSIAGVTALIHPGINHIAENHSRIELAIERLQPPSRLGRLH